MEGLTEKEKAVLDYITECYSRNGVPPSVRDIQKAMNIGSTSTVHTYIDKLVKKGCIKKEGGKSRSIRPSTSTPVYSVPVIGRVTAGAPVYAFEEVSRYVNFCSSGRRYDAKNLFALNVSGSSMKNAGILDGDIVIVEKTPYAEDGQIIVALIDEEATVKRFFREGDRFRLQPENEDYEPIFTDSLSILGRVIASIRYY